MTEKTEALIAEAERLIAARGEDRPDSRIIQGLIALAAPLDPEKVAEVIDYYFDIPSDRLELITRALCEAYTEGKLT